MVNMNERTFQNTIRSQSLAVLLEGEFWYCESACTFNSCKSRAHIDELDRSCFVFYSLEIELGIRIL